MIPTTRFHLKQPTGWFAAGREIEQALTLFSDAAFKLFLWLCLHAERSRGALSVSPADLASALHKSESDILAVLDELLLQGACNVAATGVIEITDRFWPYHRRATSAATDGLALYTFRVKRCFLERRCVRSTFTPADEQLAAQLYRNGVSLLDVERAIFLGSLRKHAALANNHRGTPITALHYFTALFDEVRKIVSPTYWTYVCQKLQTFEQPLHAQSDLPQQETK